MDQQGFLRLAVVAFGLVLASFLVLGFARLLLPYRTAQLLAAPVGVCGFLLAGYLFLRAVGAAIGVAPIEDGR